MIKLQIKRGSKANLPDFDVAEYGFTTDTEELYIGGPEGNRQIPLLGTDGKLPESYLPGTISSDLTEISDKVEGLEGDIAALGKELHDWWVYLKENFDYTCDMPADTSTKPYSYTETAKDGQTTKGTLVTTMNADGTYTEQYTIGTTSRTRTWSKVGQQWKGVWS